jgi:hypothetical protein
MRRLHHSLNRLKSWLSIANEEQHTGGGGDMVYSGDCWKVL